MKIIEEVSCSSFVIFGKLSTKFDTKVFFIKNNSYEFQENLINFFENYLYKRQRIRVIKKLPNSEQSYKGKVKTHNYINRQKKDWIKILAQVSNLSQHGVRVLRVRENSRRNDNQESLPTLRTQDTNRK